eukprot:1146364-Pelagomonas_calceolata.AAC.2
MLKQYMRHNKAMEYVQHAECRHVATWQASRVAAVTLDYRRIQASQREGFAVQVDAKRPTNVKMNSLTHQAAVLRTIGNAEMVVAF